MNIKQLSCVLLCYTSVLTGALDHTSEQFLLAFLQQYQRPYTIFEISGDGTLSSPTLTMNDANKATAVALLATTTDKLSEDAHEVIGHAADNIIILKPHHLSPKSITTLGRCEQPDVTVVHGISTILKHASPPYLDLMLGIGDYLGIDIPVQDLDLFKRYHHDRRLITTIPHTNNAGGFFAFFKTGKKGLMMARWSSPSYKKTLPYQVTSTFKNKTLYNRALRKSSTWHKGINLLTFVMLSGIYPSDESIMRELKKLDGIKHNDLVIGNILIQGLTLKPIDCNDRRRKSNSHYCINALLYVFKHRQQYASPNAFLNAYKRFFKKH